MNRFGISYDLLSNAHFMRCEASSEHESEFRFILTIQEVALCFLFCNTVLNINRSSNIFESMNSIHLEIEISCHFVFFYSAATVIIIVKQMINPLCC